VYYLQSKINVVALCNHYICKRLSLSTRDKRSNLFCLHINNFARKFHNNDYRARCYKPFCPQFINFHNNLECLCLQAFPAWSNVCRKGWFTSTPLKGRLPTLPTDILKGWKILSGTNTLANYQYS
jgi:hypothetical protein